MKEDDVWKEVSRLRDRVGGLVERIVKLETIIGEKEKGSIRKTAITAAVVGGIVSAIITAVTLIIQLVLST